MNAPKKVLIIDDMFTIRTFIKALLRGKNYTLLEAHDGAEGLEKARRELPNLIITDVKMPRVTGIEICRAARAEPGLAATPIIVLTGERDDAGTRKAALEAGATAYLRKPVNADELEETITRLLG